MMFKIKQRTKYPVEYSRKCHEKMIPIIESAKNQIANKIAKVNPPISREHRNKTPITISIIAEIIVTQLKSKIL